MSENEARIPDDIAWAMAPNEPSSTMLIQGSPKGEPKIALVVKRTFILTGDGRCELAPEEDQEPVVEGEIPYYEIEPPFVAPIAFGNDAGCFRELTDVIVQGNAYTYDSNLRAVQVAVDVNGLRRSLNVYGDRRIEKGPDGVLRFTPPESFESMGLRYDRAYGGYDAIGALNYHSTEWDELKTIREDDVMEVSTPFHYARNPAGTGFCIDFDERSLLSTTVPNLEFPWDPLSPERMSVGGLNQWLAGPLPASFDWIGASWFPRVGYLGLTPWAEDFVGEVLECQRGWASSDLLQIKPFLHDPHTPPRQEYTLSASPGMSFADLRSDSVIDLYNLHHASPHVRIELPGEIPLVTLDGLPESPVELEPQLASIVVRPDDGHVIMTWCCHAKGAESYSRPQVEKITHEINWQHLTSR